MPKGTLKNGIHRFVDTRQNKLIWEDLHHRCGGRPAIVHRGGVLALVVILDGGVLGAGYFSASSITRTLIELLASLP